MIETSTPTLINRRNATSLFYYQNATNRLQIIRTSQMAPQWFEKVVFPGEQVLFYSTLDASLDIYTSTIAGLTLIDRVPCSQLQVLETEL